MPFRFSEITWFPFSGMPKIVSAMLEQSVELMKIHHKIAKCFCAFGISLERKRFRPHVTLGRLKFRSRKPLTFQPQQIFLEGVSEKVVIFGSDLAPKERTLYFTRGDIIEVISEVELMENTVWLSPRTSIYMNSFSSVSR